ncbi:MAG TPA: hypothetical protein VIF43_02385 [Patescibacteria group bacterium]|jgi:DNA-binding MarR family transcriptional regulator
MSERTEIQPEPNESERYEAGRVAILDVIAQGEYDPGRSPQEIADRLGLSVNNVRQLTFGMIARKEIAWGRDRKSGMSCLALTEAGEDRLARSAETC